MELLEKFEENLRQCNVKSGQTVVLGVSGGIDSVVMLDMFLKSKLDLTLIIAHLNHGVRIESDKDEKLVQIVAKKHNLEFVSKKITPPKGGNLEEELRIKRREFLLNTQQENKADFIALAHNMNDQAETFFLNVLRGSGPAGLGAIRMSDQGIIRPLLDFSRAEIVEYGEENNLTWHEDKTNADIVYRRNYLRHKVFPLFADINPNWTEAVNRTALIMRKVDDYLKVEAEKILEKPIDITNLQVLDRPILFEVFGLLFERTKGDRKDLTLQNLEDLEKLISSTAGTKTIVLNGNVSAVRHYKSLDFVLKKTYNNSPLISLEGLELGENYFGPWLVKAEQVANLGSNSKYSIFVSEEVFKKIKVKTWKTGDKISPFGINGSKKLQDLFVDAKIDREKRYNWPIFFLGKELIWIPKLALSRNFVSSGISDIKITSEEKV
jgi:tRNA(Ile)-lysidine synthase